MKGNSPLFECNRVSSKENPDASLNLKTRISPHRLPMNGVPNSTSIQKDDKGNVVRIRHYDENGVAYKDVDYTDHGTPNIHQVPHTHIITNINGIIDRKKGAISRVY